MVDERTNKEFINDLIDNPKTGLEQFFIIDALTKRAKDVAATSDETIKELEKKRPLINMWKWRETAINIEKALKEKYNE